MITKKIKHKFIFDVELQKFHLQFNNVIRYAFNRFCDSKGKLKNSDIEKLVKSKMNNIQKLDASFIKEAVSKAKDIYVRNKKKDGNCKKVIFGGKSLFNKRSKKKITKQEFKIQKLIPIKFTGSKNDNGNRKFELDLKNHRIIFKRDKNHHYIIELNKFSKCDEKLLYLLQDKYNKNKKGMPFTIEFNKEYIFIIFDETNFKNENYFFIKGRTASIDMNPNYISLVIQDNKRIIQKQIYSLKQLNDLDNKNKYQNKKDKTLWRKHLNNKRKHETLQISKNIINTCIHYKVESFIIEDLNIKSNNLNKGKSYNKLCLNNWQRNLLFNNLNKRCNLNNISFNPVYAGYSSIKGQLQNEKQIDSIAAAIEIGKRKNKNLKNFGNTKIEFENLSNHWKKEISSNFKQIPTWKQISEFLKKKFGNSSYRNFFSDTNKNIKVSFSLNSNSSYIKLFCFI